MTPEELERVGNIIDGITLSEHNAKTSIVDGRVVCAPKRPGVVIMAFGPTSEGVTMFQANPEWEILSRECIRGLDRYSTSRPLVRDSRDARAAV